MRKSAKFVFFSVVLMMSTHSAADVPRPNIEISYEEFRGRCLHPREYDRRTGPENLSLSCTLSRKSYVPFQPETVLLPKSSGMTSYIVERRYKTTEQTSEHDEAPVRINCSNYKEIETIYFYVKQIECDDLVDIKVDSNELCNQAFADLEKEGKLATMPSDTRDTGQTIRLCPQPAGN